MIGYDQARALLAARVQPLASEQVALIDAAGRVLAEPVRAAVASPRRDVSAMDGYALRDADAAIGARLRVIGESFAGGPLPPPLGPGEAVRIFTGAALPQGADRVVMQENCSADGAVVTIDAAFGPGWHVRRAGSDFAAGDLLLEAGRWLDPRALVALAGADRDHAMVYRAPRLAIIATGDELAPPGSARDQALAIPESVSFGVAALAGQAGARVVERLSGRDDLEGLRQLAARALACADVVVVTGGASVGERDFAKVMFAAHDPEMLFAKVAMKPGKPVWMAQAKGRWIVGLPGNPTSAMVTARLFLAPLLAALQGRALDEVLGWEDRPLAAALPPAGDRVNFVRAAWSDQGLVPLLRQDSSAQSALAQAEWLVRQDPGVDQAAPGQRLPALRW